MALPPPSPDSTALITGASSGIGLEVAKILAAKGHGVTLVARREDRLKELADELATTHGIRAEYISADMSEASARGEMVDAIAARGLTVEVLINNAGFSTVGRVAEARLEDELRLVRLDVEAVLDLCVRFVPQMVERGRGAILNVASIAAFQPMAGQASYHASKAFVLAYTDGLHHELSGTGVTATSLCPGPVHTGFMDAIGTGGEELENALPGFLWEGVEKVASAAVRGLEKGRAVVIPGVAIKVAAYGGRVLPKSLLVPVLATQHPGMRDR